MSRIGKLPIKIPSGVSYTVDKSNNVTVVGPKGQLKRQVNPDISIETEEGSIIISRPTEQKRHRAMHGLYRTLINNMVVGVSNGYTRELELIGVGYKAEAKGNMLELSLGYSHPIIFVLPGEIKCETVTLKGQNPKITLTGIDKELLGQIAAKIRSLRPPEPYKGKGVRYMGEIVRRKEGKTAGGKKK
ncbi:MAG: 50S ribosomal protein L6 [Bacteroidia bacterium]|jgi:large subunit ribosomal protein L6|nr:50S ribosomal protein L6 [Bacteroidia bacterium]